MGAGWAGWVAAGLVFGRAEQPVVVPARIKFSHRHAHVFYQDLDGYYNPINNVLDKSEKVRKFIASNSHLSEFAVLGYELGYAQTHPNTLTLWEA